MRIACRLRQTLLALALLLAIGTAAQAAETAGGRLEKITVHGKSLEGNPSADTSDREVFVAKELATR